MSRCDDCGNRAMCPKYRVWGKEGGWPWGCSDWHPEGCLKVMVEREAKKVWRRRLGRDRKSRIWERDEQCRDVNEGSAKRRFV